MVTSIRILILQFSFLGAVAAGLPSSRLAAEQADAPKPQVGPAGGEIAPPFKARDQFGKQQSNSSLAGKNGTVLLFFRSADW